MFSTTERAMKISRLRATPVNLRFREPERWSQGVRDGVTAIVVEVETEDGETGLGESVPAPDPETTIAAIASLEAVLLGRDPRDVNWCWSNIVTMAGWGAFPQAGNAALAGVEIACWDLLGRSLDAPVHELLGGSVRDEVNFMGFVPYHPDPERVAAESRNLVREGYDTVYTKVGFGAANDLATARALRLGAGDGVQVRIDPNEAWSSDVALRMAHKLADLDLQYIEQPIRMDRIEELALLRHRSPVPIAANQSSWLNRHVLDIIQAGAADVIMTDPWQAGGLRAFNAAAMLCEIAAIPLVYHSFAPLSIATRAAIQVLATSPACGYAHQTYHGLLVGDVIRDPVRHPGGRQAVDDRPGIGVELEDDAFEEASERYEVEGYRSPYGAAGPR